MTSIYRFTIRAKFASDYDRRLIQRLHWMRRWFGQTKDLATANADGLDQGVAVSNRRPKTSKASINGG
jgi:hypothetical protein